MNVVDVPDFTALLAPTWKARARAEDALMSWMIGMEESADPWPEPVQRALHALQPSPAVFLAALLGFWAGISARQHASLMHQDADALSAPWWDMSDHAERFPMTPAQPTMSAYGMRGMWVLKFFERLGPLATEIETQLLACLGHDGLIVEDAAVCALGSADVLSEPAYRRLLDLADMQGRNGMLRDRTRVLARHTVNGRIRLVVEGVGPASTDSMQFARFSILGALEGDSAHVALGLLVSRLDEAWPEVGHAALLYALDTLCLTTCTKADALMPAMRDRAFHADVGVRSATACFVARHASSIDNALIAALADDPHPWVRSAVCRGSMSRPAMDPRLLHVLCGNSLGNYDGYDGDPHDSVVSLLLHDPVAAAQVMPSILRWWEDTTTAAWIGREPTRQAMQLCEALAPYVDVGVLLPGLERALTYLDEGTPTVELPALDRPGAVRIVRNALEADMLAAGTPSEVAGSVADLHGEVLAQIAADFERMQAEADADHEIRDAEMRELYPEWFESESAANADDQEEELHDEDEFIVELRSLVHRLRKGPSE